MGIWHNKRLIEVSEKSSNLLPCPAISVLITLLGRHDAVEAKAAYRELDAGRHDLRGGRVGGFAQRGSCLGLAIVR